MKIGEFDMANKEANLYLRWPFADGTFTLKELVIREDQGNAVILDFLDEEET